MAAKDVFFKRQFSSDTSRLYSPAIWGDCPILSILEGRTDGYLDGDDFNYMSTEDGNDTAIEGGYYSGGGYQKYIDTGNTIRLLATSNSLIGGQVALVTDATDNDSPVIHRFGTNNAGSSNLSPFLISQTSGFVFKTWFEARWKVTVITDDVNAVFVGLGAGTAATFAADNGVLEDDTGDVVDSKSVIGFRIKHKNGGTTGQNSQVDFVYQDNAQTAPTVVQAGIGTMVADTFVKTGFVIDPNRPITQRGVLYYNNVEQSSYITSTAMAAATFPLNDPLSFVAAQKNGSATAGGLTLDWWRCVQVYSSM